MTQHTHATARLTLAKARRMTSLMEREIAAEGPDMVFDKSNWVPLYYDRGQAVRSDCGTMVAYRALTLKGAPLWMVFTPGKAHGYHASCSDPFDAMDRARGAWAKRRAVRQQWDEVERTARALIRGRKRFDVRVEDLHSSPLCELGIDGFRRAIGMRRVTRMPGWLAALIMKFEPQMGFVLYEAMQRQARSTAAPAHAQPA